MFKNKNNTKSNWFNSGINKSSSNNLTNSRSFIKKPIDKSLLSVIIILAVFGLVILFSASLVSGYAKGDTYFYVKKQAIALVIGLVLFFILTRVNYHIFKKFSFFFLLLSILLLVLVFVPGIRSEYATSYSWIIVFGQSFQVAEAVKLFLIFYLAAWVETRQDDLKIFSTGLLPFLVVISFIGILLLLEPDLGTFMLIVIIALSIYFVAGGNMKQLMVMFLLAVIGLVMLFSRANQIDTSNSSNDGLIKDYQLTRIKCLQDPDFDKDNCYQVSQSLIAIGSGGLWGRGLGNSLQKFNYLPEVWADSIFPVIAEEIGFVGSVVILLIYLFIFIKGALIAKRAPDIYGRSLAIGISVWIFFQAFLNIGGMINLIPMTGVPLPFVSAGGTSLVFLLMACGILLNISSQELSEKHNLRLRN
ncbi:MAG TPA: putative lipid II flippase FtsW [bacterium]|nr:putative lipid II flippase FtsW [bacterium]